MGSLNLSALKAMKSTETYVAPEMVTEQASEEVAPVVATPIAEKTVLANKPSTSVTPKISLSKMKLGMAPKTEESVMVPETIMEAVSESNAQKEETIPTSLVSSESETPVETVTISETLAVETPAVETATSEVSESIVIETEETPAVETAPIINASDREFFPDLQIIDGLDMDADDILGLNTAEEKEVSKMEEPRVIETPTEVITETSVETEISTETETIATEITSAVADEKPKSTFSFSLPWSKKEEKATTESVAIENSTTTVESATESSTVLEPTEETITETTEIEAKDYVAQVKEDLSEVRPGRLAFLAKKKILASILVFALVSISGIAFFYSMDSIAPNGKTDIIESGVNTIPQPPMNEVLPPPVQQEYVSGKDYQIIHNTKKNQRNKTQSGSLLPPPPIHNEKSLKK